MEEENLKYEILKDENMQTDLSYKLIVIGDSGVGKSCLTTKAVSDQFEEFHNATIGFEFFKFIIKIEDTTIKLQIWDTCGQETYRALISSFYKNCSLAIMVYSIDNMESFESLDYWLKETKSHSNPDLQVILIGNKADLEERRKVPIEKAQEFVSDNTLQGLMEVSAKTGFNAQNVFIKAAKLLYIDHMKYKDKYVRNSLLNELSQTQSRAKLSLPNPESDRKKEKKKCCG